MTLIHFLVLWFAFIFVNVLSFLIFATGRVGFDWPIPDWLETVGQVSFWIVEGMLVSTLIRGLILLWFTT
jgi:hypothetical protein